MSNIAIIGGTGLTSIKSLEITRREMVSTPYGEPSGPLTHGMLCGHNVVFLARHGYGHTIPPHDVNYRANIWALKSIGVENILAVAAVGGIREDLVPGKLVIPDQIIDYTWSRGNTFFDRGEGPVKHIDFTWPYCESMRQLAIDAAKQAGLDVSEGGTYAATQGPRLETAAEVTRLEKDGADMVGMTGMPEAALARELELCYASCAVVANRAAGRGDGEITIAEIEENLVSGMQQVEKLLEVLLPTCRI
ncbi:MAG: S-methyl-5'-thioinosine phosphorylase [Sulfuriflexus sp.]|nr:S-methyl-5'-thioinosine phosphorylase [Sulfuriflexus sp.]